MTIFTNISQTNSGGSDIDIEKIANTDLSNLTAVGETHFANKSLSNIDALGQAKFLNKQMITNCLISATSGLVTASGDTLTVPSGLIFLIPNGVDATTSMIKNIEITTSVATTFTESSSQYGTRVLFYNSDNTLTSYLQSEIEYDSVLKYWKANGSKIVAKNLATYYWDGSDISSFIPEQVATIEMSSMGAVLDTKANISFDNLADSAKNISNWSSNVSNCFVEIPQDIKLELDNGTLTIKAGSKVYVPNGAGVFDVITTASDLTMSQSAYTDTYMIYRDNNNGFARESLGRCFSGSTAPSGYSYMLWYDTTNNLVKRTTDGGSTWISGCSLPIALVSTVANTSTTINQVFNGFGYIGSTKFILPGVKGLIPNGTKPDGSFKSISLNIAEVRIMTGASTDSEVIGVVGVNSINNYHTPELVYDEASNYMYHSGEIVYQIPYTNSYSQVSGKIDTNIKFKSVFHATDYSDIAGLDDYIIERQEPTSDNNYTWYRKYKSGWVEQGRLTSVTGGTSAQITLPIPLSNYNISLVMISGDTNMQNEVLCAYDTTSTGFKVASISDSSTSRYFRWMVCGK